MLYFSSAPVRLDSVDRQQYESLLEFKNSCKQRGLIEEYESPPDFREKFSRQLAQTVIRSFLPLDLEATFEPAHQTNSVPTLSSEAQRLLAEAAKDSHGRIVRMDTMGGLYIQTNGREFIEQRTAREEV